MAESSWPSPSNGRVVDDSQYERIGALLGPGHGVFGDYTNPQLLFADSSGRQVKIGATRYALVRGHVWYSGASVTTVPIAANTSGSTRQDTIVLRLSRTTFDVNVTVIQGTPGGGAPSPTLNDSTGSWDLLLGSVSVANNASTLAAGTVTYKAVHLDQNGGRLRVPSVSEPWGLPGAAYLGMEVIAADGTVLRWNGSAYEERYGWKDYSAVVYHNMATTRSTFGSFSINRARYNKVGKMVWATADLSVTGITTGGMSASLPVAAAASMQNSIIGAGAVVNSGGAPGQDGFVIVGTGLDCVQPVTITTGFINTTTGANRYRFTVCYESAT